jgi:hypothetical protein
MEKTREVLQIFEKSKPSLKKSKIPLRELIMKEYPGTIVQSCQKFISFYFENTCTYAQDQNRLPN